MAIPKPINDKSCLLGLKAHNTTTASTHSFSVPMEDSTSIWETSEIEEMQNSTVSLMPADLQKTMSTEDLINIVEYLTTLRGQ